MNRWLGKLRRVAADTEPRIFALIIQRGQSSLEFESMKLTHPLRLPPVPYAFVSRIGSAWKAYFREPPELRRYRVSAFVDS